MIKPELFIDMDDTIYNLGEEIIRHYNFDYKDNFDYKTNTQYFWQDTKAPQSYFEEVMQRRGVFLNGNPIGNSIEILNKLYGEGCDIYFMTMPQWYSPYCKTEKIMWLQKHFKWFDPYKHIIFTGNKRLLGGEYRILYDDNLKFLNSWNGYAIAYNQPWNKEYVGYKVNNHDDFYDKVHKITNLINERQTNINTHAYKLYYNSED